MQSVARDFKYLYSFAAMRGFVCVEKKYLNDKRWFTSLNNTEKGPQMNCRRVLRSLTKRISVHEKIRHEAER